MNGEVERQHNSLGNLRLPNLIAGSRLKFQGLLLLFRVFLAFENLGFDVPVL